MQLHFQSTVFRAIVLPHLRVISTPFKSKPATSFKTIAGVRSERRKRGIETGLEAGVSQRAFSSVPFRQRAAPAVEAREFEYPDPWTASSRNDQLVPSSSSTPTPTPTPTPTSSSDSNFSSRSSSTVTINSEDATSKEKGDIEHVKEEKREETSGEGTGRGKEIQFLNEEIDEVRKKKKESLVEHSELSLSGSTQKGSPLHTISNPRLQPCISTTNPEQLRKLSATATLPPALARLVSSRLFRMAVFYLFSHDHFSKDPVIIELLAKHLDAGGAVLQARRLRRALRFVEAKVDRNKGDVEGNGLGLNDSMKNEYSNTSSSNPDLLSKSNPDTTNNLSPSIRPNPPNYWVQPRSYDVPRPPNLTRQQRLTLHYNTQLSYLTFPPPPVVLPPAFQRFALNDPRNPRFGKRARTRKIKGLGEGSGNSDGRDLIVDSEQVTVPKLSRRQKIDQSKFPSQSSFNPSEMSETQIPKENQNPIVVYPPVKRLKHLHQLLTRIDTLVKHRGFVPDRVTANIVVKCWLDSLYRSGYDGRTVLGSDGSRKQVRALDQVLAMTATELENVFNLVSTSFQPPPPPPSYSNSNDSLSIPSLSPSASHSWDVFHLGRERPDLSEEIRASMTSEISYQRHVRPFGLMMIRAMSKLGDLKGKQKVKEWLKVWKERSESYRIPDELQ